MQRAEGEACTPTVIGQSCGEGWTTRPSWTVTIATFDPPSPDYRRHRRLPLFLKARLHSVDPVDKDGRVPSPR